MEITVTKNKAIFVLVFLGVVILLGAALIHSEIQRAKSEAATQATLEASAKLQETSKQAIQSIKDAADTQTKAIQEEMDKRIRNSEEAMAVLMRNIPNAKPTIIQVPSPNQPAQNASLPNAPEPQIKKDNLLCYDEKGQIELAKYSDQCRKTTVELGAAQATIVEKDKIITAKEHDVETLKKEKNPTRWHTIWTVTKWVAPTATAAYFYGKSKGKK